MNFKEYINQKDIKKMSLGTVLLYPEDCETIFNVGEDKTVILHILGMRLEYTTRKPNGLPKYDEEINQPILYTTDGDGNPKVGSVFKLILDK